MAREDKEIAPELGGSAALEVLENIMRIELEKIEERDRVIGFLVKALKIGPPDKTS
jgi:hypothetical protein